MNQLIPILDFFNGASSLLLVLAGFWWLYMPVLLFIILLRIYQNYTTLSYIKSLNWILLELRVPKDPGKSPKAAEQIFAALHAASTNIKWREKFFKGKVPDWFSLEIVGSSGEIHFYIRTPEQYRKLVESQIYAQYPDSEIIAVEDYVAGLPSSMPDDQYDLWGAELALTKEDAYPIRTYPVFDEKPSGPTDIKRIDPLSSLTEVFGTLEFGEHIGIHLLVRPTGDAWVKKGQAVVDKLMGKDSKAAGPDFLGQLIFEIDKHIPGHVPPAEKEVKKDKPDVPAGKQEAIKAIDKAFGKLGYESGIRFIYSAPKDKFHRPHIAGVVGFFKQFSSQTLNGFKLNLATAPIGRWPFKKQKEFKKKVVLLTKYKNRSFPKKPFILNTEELATIYHFPDVGVKAPFLPRIDAKKGEPPVGLPM